MTKFRVLDGSIIDLAKSKSLLTKPNIEYYKDSDFEFEVINDQSLRGVLFEKIKQYIKEENDNTYDYWIVCVHPDQ